MPSGTWTTSKRGSGAACAFANPRGISEATPAALMPPSSARREINQRRSIDIPLLLRRPVVQERVRSRQRDHQLAQVAARACKGFPQRRDRARVLVLLAARERVPQPLRRNAVRDLFTTREALRELRSAVVRAVD